MEDYKYYNYFYYILFPIYKLKGISLIKKKNLCISSKVTSRIFALVKSTENVS